MPGHFPLFTDENIIGPLIEALRRRGWDVERAVDIFGERKNDPDLLEYAAQRGRVLVSVDRDIEQIAESWLSQWRSFPGVIHWRQVDQRRMTVGEFIQAFEDLASREEPFAYPIQRIKPRR